jgi:hypothetical protein
MILTTGIAWSQIRTVKGGIEMAKIFKTRKKRKEITENTYLCGLPWFQFLEC